MPARRIYLRELAEIVNRTPHTIRQWERSINGKDPILPDHLWGQRDERDWRYWDQRQVNGIIKWMEREGIAPGKGLSAYKPSPEQVTEMLRKLRQPRGAVSAE